MEPMTSAPPILSCPVCHDALTVADRTARCPQRHSFDQAREGYFNLLSPRQSRRRDMGDDADMVHDRRAFLDRGHYAALSDGLRQWVGELAPGTLLDVGCGEGSFTRAMLDPIAAEDARYDARWVAFDISKPAMRLTARRVPQAVSVIASVNSLPALDASVDLVCSVMSPVHDLEFARVLAPGGRVLLVTPGASHLAELRAQLYEEYRPHDEDVTLAHTWPVLEQRRFQGRASLRSNEEILQVWGMTPYRWNAPVEGAARIAELDSLDITVDFLATLLAPPPAVELPEVSELDPVPDELATDDPVLP